MRLVTAEENSAFFAEAAERSAASGWCAIGTLHNGEPRVRMVHPTWDGDIAWFCTKLLSPKAQELQASPLVDLHWQVSPPDFFHVKARGRVELYTDVETKQYMWDVMDFDLTKFATGPSDPAIVAIKVIPTRVEISQSFGHQNIRVWSH